MTEQNRIFKVFAISLFCLALSGCVGVVRYDYMAPSIENAVSAIEETQTGAGANIGADTVAICADYTEHPSFIVGPYINDDLLCGHFLPAYEPNSEIVSQDDQAETKCFPLEDLSHIGRPYKSIAFGYYPFPIHKPCPISR